LGRRVRGQREIAPREGEHAHQPDRARRCCRLVPTAAGDSRRLHGGRRQDIPGNTLLPQAGPGDTLYVTPSTVPVPGGDATDLTATLDKTLTERFGIGIQNGYNWIGRKDASTLVGWQNLLAYVK